ncbi:MULTISPECIES: hypothetical protein [unclassified Citrobacter]|uniref:hypothetical protein n=1 Tax=unclassified Citrobacter TaxID=2644389 RepID=UPI0015EA9222|nr:MULTISPECIES: hypothetical protein [unclassified Citrobacter]QLT53784.1 hypothetical protein HV285_10660 [Citrobacter sp. RHBSTW-00821]QLU30069.1 hypothetical protein HV199_10640 [Citrobacter sp. RHBSTW-00446]QLZ78099.1 hypothetical protein HV072_10645 [Citrobacter sp. RHBSTW-00107]QMR50667.1 hypothetical protein HV296_14035 [Citrobacter sp. RHBSTW-00848]
MREGLTLAWFNPHGTVKRLPLHFTVICRHITTLIENSSDYFALLIVSSEDMFNFNTIEKNSVSLYTEINLPAGIVI